MLACWGPRLPADEPLRGVSFLKTLRVMMNIPARVLIAAACLALLAACDAPIAATGGFTRANAEARYSDIQHLATENARQEGLDASFASREVHGHKVLMKHCVVRFTKEGTTVAAAEGEIDQGKFTFRGTPVLRTGSQIRLGDQQAVVIAAPKEEGRYEVATAGAGQWVTFP